MNYKKITPDKLRARLIRKGVFTQFPIPEQMRDFEGEIKIARTLLDLALHEATSPEEELRKDAFKFMNPESSCANRFDLIAETALFYPHRARSMMLNLLDNFFPEVLVQTSCR